MRVLVIALVCASGLLYAGNFHDSIPRPKKKTLLGALSPDDSLVYYQCHVETATSQLTTTSGQTLTSGAARHTITEKFVLVNTPEGVLVRYYTSALSVFPNKKFSGLKIRERPYWGFSYVRSRLLSADERAALEALERKGHEANEFDFAISKYNTNQIIIKQKKDFRQLVIEGNYVISRLLGL